ncbi:hypothetical protein CRUP_009402 [Coryphaenoides rupestris]|nr:hypothetical protein CRUP_009402 [Coryphaenoides rupestris]
MGVKLQQRNTHTKSRKSHEEDGPKVLVLSYPQYCRYRSVLARLSGRPSSSALLADHTVLALGGIAALGANTRVLYCRDTFEHPVLLQNESICDEFAPNLKGRPRKKKLSVFQRRDSQSQGQGSTQGSMQGSSTAVASQEPCSLGSKRNPTKLKPSSNKVSGVDGRISSTAKPKVSVHARAKSSAGEEKERGKDKDKEKEKEERKEKKEERKEKKAERKRQQAEEEEEKKAEEAAKAAAEEEQQEEETAAAEENSAEEQAFLVALYKYMKERDTPIERIPFLGFKQSERFQCFLKAVMHVVRSAAGVPRNTQAQSYVLIMISPYTALLKPS